MSHSPSRHLDPAVVLVAILVAANLLAVTGLVRARRDARTAVREGLALEIRADARAFEARLAREQAQLEFLARSRALRGAATPEDPVAARWARLDLEATLLLYLQSSPAARRLQVRNVDEILALAVRVEGTPSLAQPGDATSPEANLLHASWPLGEGQRVLDAWVDPQPLADDLGDHLHLWRSLPDADGPFEAISSPGWSPPLAAWLERSDSDTRVLGAVERLADLYRSTLVLNVALLPLTLFLGALTVRRVRRLASLESERQQKKRLRALELQVQHAERLASLGRFAAGLAHEINNPLEGMANYVQLVRDDLDAQRVADAQVWLPRLDEGIDRMAGIVRQVLHFAEPGAHFEPVDLAVIVERTVDFLRPHPDCRSTRLTLHCAPGLLLHGDAVGLGQLALNLVLNACQMQDGGEVEIVASGGDHTVEMQVLDRGPGVAPEIRDRLFEPFLSTRGSTGLGLAVCHGIVSRHGGSLSIQSRAPGPGSVARVELPRGGVDPESQHRPQSDIVRAPT